MKKKITASEYDLNDSIHIGNSAFTILKKETSAHYSIYLSQYVEEPATYAELHDFFIQRTTSEDKVTIHLTNYGGDAYACAGIINGMKLCPATIEVEVLSPIFSAATMIALSGDSLILRPNSLLMIHNYSGEFGGKGHEIKSAFKHENDMLEKMFNSIYVPFLSKSEVAKVIAGQDIYIQHDDADLQQRLNRHFGEEDEV